MIETHIPQPVEIARQFLPFRRGARLTQENVEMLWHSEADRRVRGLLERAHKNVVVVALANKLARIAWAGLAHGCAYVTQCEAAAVA